MGVHGGVDDIPLLGCTQLRQFGDREFHETAGIDGRHDPAEIIDDLDQRYGTCRRIRHQGLDVGWAQRKSGRGRRHICRTQRCRADIKRHYLGNVDRTESGGSRIIWRQDHFATVGAVSGPVLDDHALIGQIHRAGRSNSVIEQGLGAVKVHQHVIAFARHDQ